MRSLLLAPLLIVSAPAVAEEAQVTPQDTDEAATAPPGGEIIVVATRIRGQVDAPQPPVITLEENDIAAYGAGSIAELVAALSPQTSSGRGRGDGRPVFLINGQRVSSFREMRSIPPEAIRKVEVLPEEVALRFGYPPNQRVMNFILKDNFSTVTVAGEYNIPTLGGFANSEIEASFVRIDGPRRLNLETKATDDSLLTEAERGVRQAQGSIPTVPGDPDPAAFRSLIDDTRELTLNGTWTTGLGEEGMDGSLSVNSAVTQNDSRALLGLDTFLLVDPDGDSALRSLGDPLERVRRTRTYQLGTALNKPLGDWQLTATGDASYADSQTRIDREIDAGALVDAAAQGLVAIDGALPTFAPAGLDRTRSKDLSLSSLATLVGTPFRMPAGEASLTLRAGYDYDRSRNSDTRGNLPVTLTRGNASTGFNLGLPITSRREGVLGAIGDIALNLSAGIDRLSDFGTLVDWNAGVTWNVTDKLGLQASYIVNEAAPSLSNLGSPELAIANVPVFDFTRGETTLATIITGGNPDLRKEKQRDLKVSATWQLPFLERSNLIVEYFRNRSDDVTRSFPLLTPEIEAAFPGRAVRDASGRLVSIDRRPVTYDRVSSSRIRWGFNLSGRIGEDERGGGGGGGRREPSAAPAPAPASAAPAAKTATGPGGGRRFDPARFAALRETWCAPGATPDATTLPEEIQVRLRGADGQVDPERLARMKARICAAAGETGQVGGWQGGGGRDPQRFAQTRQALCGDTPPDPALLPERMRERLLAQDGTIDPVRLAAARQRICNSEMAAAPSSTAPTEEPAAAGPGGGGRGGMGAGMPFGRGGNGGRWNLSVYHTYRIDEKVRIAPGGPVLDLLGGDALDAGGVARHALEFEGGLFKNGKGLRLSGSWLAPVTVRSNGAPGASDLRFGSTFILNARTFIDLGRDEKLVERFPLAKGVRVSLTADNIFNSRQKVTDASGLVPISYQADFRDPRGRVIGIDIRKMF